MKNSVRIGVVVIFIVGIIFAFYHFGLRFWPFYPFWGWRYHYFGPRIWPVFPFFGLLILIVAGILIAKYFFQALRDSSMPKKEELIFCPFCGKDLRRQDRTISEIQPEKLQ
jgi:hypothetical protein